MASNTNASGLSLHIGLNLVDPSHYAGWSGPLAACENDARAMGKLAAKRGFSPTQLLTRQATRGRVLAEIEKATRRMRKGDAYLLTYSGHGGQVPDVTGDEPDKKDETWCLFDGQLIDDELYSSWPLRRRRAHPRPLRQLPQRHGDARAPCRRRRTRPAAEADARGGRRCAPTASTRRSTTSCSATSPPRPAPPVVDPDAALAQVAGSGRASAQVVDQASTPP